MGSNFYDNFGAKGAAVSYGAHAMVANTGANTINECTFKNNHADEHGGAIYFHHGSVSITFTQIQQNTARAGGGIYFEQGGNLYVALSTLSGNGAAFGGGAWAKPSVTTFFNGCNLANNGANGQGQGLYIDAAGFGDNRRLLSDVTAGVNATQFDNNGVYTVGGVIDGLPENVEAIQGEPMPNGGKIPTALTNGAERVAAFGFVP